MMNSVFIVSLLVLGVVQAQDAVTTAKLHHHHCHAACAHTTHEARETEFYSFVYDARSHDMVVKTSSTCYIILLTDTQRAMVHDPAEIKKVEPKALRLITDNSVQSNIDQSVLDHHLEHFCRGSAKIILLANN